MTGETPEEKAIRLVWEARAAVLNEKELEVAAYVLGDRHTANELRRCPHKKDDPPVPPSYSYRMWEKALKGK